MINIKTLLILYFYPLLNQTKIGSFLIEILIFIRFRYYLLRIGTPEFNALQEERFHRLKKQFRSKYINLKGSDAKFTDTVWKSYEKSLKKILLPYPKISFLREMTLLRSMVATGRDEWLEKAFNEIPKNIIVEDYIGRPLLYNKITSNNAIEHYTHIKTFKLYIKDEINIIVEWGGGYGSMAKLLWREKPRTYIMIDLPIACVLQWLYLSTALGEENVYIFQSPQDKIRQGKINIIPVFWTDAINVKPDLFISTWALSESSRYSQDFILRKKWFNAKHILLAYNADTKGRFVFDKRLKKVSGARVVKIEYLKGENYYIFK